MKYTLEIHKPEGSCCDCPLKFGGLIGLKMCLATNTMLDTLNSPSNCPLITDESKPEVGYDPSP